MAKPSIEELYKKYAWTSWFYDFLDYPWERQYRRWRPRLLEDVSGAVLEAGQGQSHGGGGSAITRRLEHRQRCL